MSARTWDLVLSFAQILLVLSALVVGISTGNTVAPVVLASVACVLIPIKHLWLGRAS